MHIEKFESIVFPLVQNWIQDLVSTGMSYSRISFRLNLSPSTIQKIATKKRVPRTKTLCAMGRYYLKIFEAPQNYGPATIAYYTLNEERIKDTIYSTKCLLMGLSVAA